MPQEVSWIWFLVGRLGYHSKFIKSGILDVRHDRDNKAVREILKKLVDEDKQGDVNLATTLIEACKAYATIGEIWGSLRQGRGLSYDPFNMIESPFKD